MWSPDGQKVNFGGTDRATARVYAISVDSGSRRLVTPEDMFVTDYALNPQGRLVAVMGNASTPNEIYVQRSSATTFEQFTNFGQQYERIGLGQVERIQWRSKDDRFDVDGYVIRPPDYHAGRRYPLLVNLHGGPGDTYLNRFVDINVITGQYPTQIFAAAGYVVLLPNPRGDRSYSRAFHDALRENWGADALDVEAGVAYLIERGVADPKKIGLMGHSYGAYLVTQILTETDRYRAASISEGAVNRISDYGQLYPDFVEFYQYHLGGTPWQRPELYRRLSPIFRAERIKTPMLLRYGNKRQGPVRNYGVTAQGLELYAALKENGTPVDFIVHPDEGHGIADGNTYRDYVRRNLAWFDYWILGKGHNPLVTAKEQ